MNQHRQDIQPGDRVWFRITGPAAGIYPVGRVASLPRKESNEFGDWHADVTFESRVNPPLLRAESEPSNTFDNAMAAVANCLIAIGRSAATT